MKTGRSSFQSATPIEQIFENRFFVQSSSYFEYPGTEPLDIQVVMEC